MAALTDVEANARVTGTMGMTLFVLFVAEGLTILARVGRVLPTHVFLGMLLVVPVLVKVGSTGYRIVRYYAGDPDYVRRGPPPWFLRLLGPFVVATTVLVIVTGVGWLLAGPGSHPWELAHKASFIFWFGAMAVHVLGHLRETPRLFSADYGVDRSKPPGAQLRRVVLAATLVAGLGLAWWSLGWVPSVWGHGRG